MRSTSKVLARISLGGLLALTVCGSASAGDVVNTGLFGGVAIMGYDTVAYFTEGKAMKGSEEFAELVARHALVFCERKRPRPVCCGSREIRAAIRRLLHDGCQR